jgi:flagellar hook-basal body complex protein FliE
MRIGPPPSLIPRELPGLAEDQASLRTAGAAGVAGTSSATEIGGANKAGFANLLERAVAEVDGKMRAGQAEQAKVLTGESTNLHQAVIAMQEASVAFSLMVEVRNKLVESYQELMRMQV